MLFVSRKIINIVNIYSCIFFNNFPLIGHILKFIILTYKKKVFGPNFLANKAIKKEMGFITMNSFALH